MIRFRQTKGFAVLKFYTDFQGEYQTLMSILSGNDISSMTRARRAAQYGIPADIADRIIPGEDSTELHDYLQRSYDLFGNELATSLASHTNYWNGHYEKYGEMLSKIFGRKIPDYTVRLNMHCGGISNWSGTDISIYAFEYLRHFKFGCARVSIFWELILSQAFMKIREKYSAADADDHTAWSISELTAVAILQVDMEHSDWPIGYDELEPHRQAIKAIYKSREDMNDYIDKAVKYFQGVKCQARGKL